MCASTLGGGEEVGKEEKFFAGRFKVHEKSNLRYMCLLHVFCVILLALDDIGYLNW
jgi:hypothetical protein